jgi:Snf7
MAKDLVRTRRYVQKFYQMRTQLQAVGLRIQGIRSNQAMADAMRGATRVCELFYFTLDVANHLSGYGIDEQGHEPAGNPEDHE